MKQEHVDNAENTEHVNSPAIQRLYTQMKARIRSEGLGYMSNTSSRANQNVKVKHVTTVRDGLHPDGLFYIAKRDIEIGEEIIAPYNNTESKNLV